MSKWPIKYRFWRRLHEVFNVLAWKYAANPVEKTRLVWRLNDWAGDKYITWYIKEMKKGKRKP